MKKKCIAALICGVVVGFSGCQTVPEFGEIAPLMWEGIEIDPIGLIFSGLTTRSGSNNNPYPDIDLADIERMPVYKATGKTEDQRADGKAIAEKFGIDYNYLASIWSDTEDVFTADGEFCADLRDDEQSFSVHIVPTGNNDDYYRERYEIVSWSENKPLEYSAVSPLESDDVSLKRIGINLPYEISSIRYTLKDDFYTCEISEEEKETIASFFTDYINDNPDIFPFKAGEYYAENKRYGLWWYNDENEICGAAGTRVIFYNCENIDEADILASHHGLTDTITAAYIVQTDWNELYQTIHSVEITVAEYSESFEKVGEYDIIPFEEAERRFKNDEEVNYTREIPADESDEYKAVYLKYITDSEGYVRPVYIYGVSPNDSSAWIDAIER